MCETEWVQELSKRYNWPDDQPGPEQVVKEAKKRGIDSLDVLIDKMEDSPAASLEEKFKRQSKQREQMLEEILSKEEKEELIGEFDANIVNGYMRWKWYRNLRDAFLGSPCDEENAN